MGMLAASLALFTMSFLKLDNGRAAPCVNNKQFKWVCIGKNQVVRRLVLFVTTVVNNQVFCIARLLSVGRQFY